MNFIQLNIALFSVTVVLASLMAACLSYSLHAAKRKIEQLNQQNFNQQNFAENQLKKG